MMGSKTTANVDEQLDYKEWADVLDSDPEYETRFPGGTSGRDLESNPFISLSFSTGPT